VLLACAQRRAQVPRPARSEAQRPRGLPGAQRRRPRLRAGPERSAAEFPFVEQVPAGRARPVLQSIRGTLEDEERSGDPQLAIIDLVAGKDVVITVPHDVLAGLLSTGTDALTWSDEEEQLYWFAHSTGQRTARLLRVDAATGERQVVISESDEPLYEPNTFLCSLPLIRVLPRSNEAIWFSQDGAWGHLYRYDLQTGARLNVITTGKLVVRDLLRVD
jgi:hypothetical protein